MITTKESINQMLFYLKDTCICFIHINNMINILWLVREGMSGPLLDVETTSPSVCASHDHIVIIVVGYGPLLSRNTTSLSDNVY